MKLTLGVKGSEIQSNGEFAGLSIPGLSLLVEGLRVMHGQKDQQGLAQPMVGCLKAEPLHGYRPGLGRGETALASVWCLRASFPGSPPALHG